MIRDLLILPGGREVFSGPGEPVAIRALTYTHQVSGPGELDFCCAGAAEIAVELLDTTGSFLLEPGTALEYYRVNDNRQRHKMGTFYAQAPERSGKYGLKFTAYDAMLIAERDLTGWLLEQSWPMTVSTLLEAVCDACGIPLEAPALCNGSHPVAQFWQQVTGRQLIAWVAESNGLFARIRADGTLVLEEISSSPTAISLSLQKTRAIADAPCAPLDRVAVCQEAGDVGVVFPENGNQTYTLTGNPLLAIPGSSAEHLYGHLQGLTYTPFTAEVFAEALELPWRPGQLVQVADGEVTHTCAVFRVQLQGCLAKLESWGAPLRDSADGAYSRDRVKILQKQMTRTRLDVQGLEAEVTRVEAEFARDQAQVREDISRIQVAADGLTAQVSQVESTVQTDLELVQQSIEHIKRQTELAVTAQGLTLALTREREAGAEKVVTRTGYTFDEEGLHIATSRSDMENRLDHSGMLVRRGQEELLRADSAGVTARDVRVGNYLIIGNHARLEDYQNTRTACFWL